MTIAQGGGSSSKDLIRSVSGHANNLMSEVAKVIIGKPENIRKVAIGILANGNILIEDNPGLAKTLMSNTFAEALGCKFKRVQFTPDLLPADIIGTYMYDQKTGEFRPRFGPLFTNILLADEINRAPPKTQAALLEAMEEKQVTIEGITQATGSVRDNGYPEPNRAGRDIPASRGSNGQIPHENEHGIPINGRGEGNPSEEEASWKG